MKTPRQGRETVSQTRLMDVLLSPTGSAAARLATAVGVVAMGQSGVATASIVNTVLNMNIAPGSSYTFGFAGGGQFSISNYSGTESLYSGTLGPVNNSCGTDPYGAALSCQYQTTVSVAYNEVYGQGGGLQRQHLYGDVGILVRELGD